MMMCLCIGCAFKWNIKTLKKNKPTPLFEEPLMMIIVSTTENVISTQLQQIFYCKIYPSATTRGMAEWPPFCVKAMVSYYGNLGYNRQTMHSVCLDLEANDIRERQSGNDLVSQVIQFSIVVICTPGNQTL